MKLKTPVLFLIWNRPDTTNDVFLKIREAEPTNLFIAADGPREGNIKDKNRCKETRRVVENIDWKCKVHTRFREKNLGLKLSVSDSISWFFSNNGEGIILEDDCLPERSFFDFCSLMLKRYRYNKNVMHISGDNFQPSSEWNKNSYYFSKYPHIWGWATWSRAWSKYDLNMENWPVYKRKNKFNTRFSNYWERVYWTTIFDAVFENKIDTWDYQWLYSIWKNNGLSINPGVNLISNLGFRADSVHTHAKDSKFSKMKTTVLSLNLKTLPIVVDEAYDVYTSKKVFNINPFQALIKSLYYKVAV